MDWVWQSEDWLSGWMLPAGSALVALGLTTLAAAAYAHWRVRSRAKSSVPGESIDLRDATVPAPSPTREKPRSDALEAEVERLARALADLRLRLESLGPEATRMRPGPGAASGRATLRRIEPSSGEQSESSPEVEALRAFVAESR